MASQWIRRGRLDIPASVEVTTTGVGEAVEVCAGDALDEHPVANSRIAATPSSKLGPGARGPRRYVVADKWLAARLCGRTRRCLLAPCQHLMILTRVSRARRLTFGPRKSTVTRLRRGSKRRPCRYPG